MNKPTLKPKTKELNKKFYNLIRGDELNLTDEQYKLMVTLSVQIQAAFELAEMFDEWDNIDESNT